MKHYNTLNRLSDNLLSNLLHLVSHWSVHNSFYVINPVVSFHFCFLIIKMSSSDEEADEPDFSTVIEDIDFETIENIHSGKVVIYINRLTSDQKMIRY